MKASHDRSGRFDNREGGAYVTRKYGSWRCAVVDSWGYVVRKFGSKEELEIDLAVHGLEIGPYLGDEDGGNVMVWGTVPA